MNSLNTTPMQKNYKKVAVLGSGGMLGYMVADLLGYHPEIEVVRVTRDTLNAWDATPKKIEKAIGDAGWVVNCMGIIKPRISTDAEEAIRVNSLFPHTLAKVPGIKIIQIATDCAFDPDIYGRSKILGEVIADNFCNIRCSIIGPGNKNSLFDWVLSQEKEVTGFTSHFWNGVTTLAFAKLCYGIIKDNGDVSVYDQCNFIPKDVLSKYELLELILEHFKPELKLLLKASPVVVDKSLSVSPDDDHFWSGSRTELLWNLAGYSEAPSINGLLVELKIYLEKGII